MSSMLVINGNFGTYFLMIFTCLEIISSYKSMKYSMHQKSMGA